MVSRALKTSGDPVDGSVSISYDITSFQLTFNSQGAWAVAAQEIPAGGMVTRPGAPTRAGYPFEGRYSAATGGTAWNLTTDPMAADTTLGRRCLAFMLAGLGLLIITARGNQGAPQK